MVFSVNTSTYSAICAANSYNKIVSQQKLIHNLSSGIKINSASDNAANLALSKKISSLKNGYKMAQNNIQTSISFLNSVENSIANMTNSLQKIRDLSVQAANGVYSASERQSLQNQVAQVSQDIKNTYETTKFGDTEIFSGSSAMMQGVSQLSAAEATAAGYDSAHIITNASEFVSKITADLGGNFILASDVNMADLGTLTTSAIDASFTGNLNGNGYSVKNLSIDTGGAFVNNIGLFKILNGSVNNLGIENANINATNSSSAGILVSNNQGGSISNCYSSGTINGGSNHIGGLVGYNSGTITKSYSSANVSTNMSGIKAGGLLGTMGNGSVTQSYATGGVTGNDRVGGFVGGVDGGTISDCYSTGNVSGQVSGIGGFAGYQTGGLIENSYTTSNVSAIAGIGGFFGEGNSVDCFYINNVATDWGSAVDGNINPLPTSSWDSSIWNLSNGMPSLITTPSTQKITLQIGADNSADSIISMAFSLDIGNVDFNINSQTSARNVIEEIDKLLEKLNEQRVSVGTQTNKLANIIKAQENRIANYENSNSVLQDTDMAQEMAKLTKQQIIQNSATSLQQQFKRFNQESIISIYNSL